MIPAGVACFFGIQVAGGLAALKSIGDPATVLLQTKERLFAA